MRIFIAIDCKHSDYFKEIQDKLRHKSNRVNFTNSYHITLKFIGEVIDDKLEQIKERLSQIKFNDFQIKTKNIGIFPSIEKMRVIWVGLNDQPELMKLQQQIEDAVGEFSNDHKEFFPHITLARIKHIEHKKAFKEMVKNVKIKSIPIKVNEFKLIKSELTQIGSKHTCLQSFTATTQQPQRQ